MTTDYLMKNALRLLQSRLGEMYGRQKLAWYCQKYGTHPLGQCPINMFNEINEFYSYGRTKKSSR